mgnify:CR=1 FL=1
MAKYIVYACPVGELAGQLHNFFEQSRERFGANAAHKYMPHCSLTGFFEDRTLAMPIYAQTLHRAYMRAYPSRPRPVIEVKGFNFQQDWHGLELESPWLKQLIVDFTCTAVSPSRKQALRPKTWLHLSLAYEFPSEQGKQLAALAQETVDPEAPVDWQLCYYQRNPDGSWICHHTWPLAE